jgi:hypothetical protein
VIIGWYQLHVFAGEHVLTPFTRVVGEQNMRIPPDFSSQGRKISVIKQSGYEAWGDYDRARAI